jgi:hypothetical protein
MSDQRELPPKYYQDYFQYLIRFVERHYGGLLNETERRFLDEFERLPEDAQCLFIRFTNRRGAFFRVRRIRYPEIEHWGQALIELEDRGFVERPNTDHAARAGELLGVFTKTELLDFGKHLGLDPKGKSSQKKEEVMDWLLEGLDFETLVDWILAQEPIVKVHFETETMMLKFLFFGNRRGDMTDFVVRDLGHLRYETFDEAFFVPHFATREEAEDRLRVSLAREDFSLMKEAETDPTEVYHWLLDWHERYGLALTDVARPGYERLLLRVGGFLERQKRPEQSLEVFRLTAQPPSRERQVRLLYKTGFQEEAIRLCEEILAGPFNADEQFFATDFIDRHEGKIQKRRTKRSTTAWLHQSESIRIGVEWKYRVEQGVIDYFERQGEHAVFSENLPWTALFGLLFWDLIFDASTAAIHHPLQRSPSDLFKPQFFEKRRAALLDRLDLLDEPVALREHLTRVFHEKVGIANPFVFWAEVLLDLILLMCERIPAEPLRRVLLDMATNPREHTRGFPDLFTWDEAGGYAFVEVKSPTDNLSSQQLYWLQFFERVGVNAKVLRVEWEVPAEPGVVSTENQTDPSQGPESV